MNSIVVGYSKRVPVLFARGIVAAAALLLSVSVSAANITIDDFSNPFDWFGFPVVSTSVSDGGMVCGSAFQNTGTILGMERDASIEITRGEGLVDVESINGLLSISMGSLTAANVTIQWDGVDSDESQTAECSLNHTGLGGTDITMGGGNQFNLLVIENDKATTLVFRVYTSSANWSFYQLNIPAASDGTTFTVNFSSFSIGGGAGVTWSNVGAIEMAVVDAPNSLDIVFDYLVTPVEYDATADSVADGEVCWGTTTEKDNEIFYVGRCLDTDDLSTCEVLGVKDALSDEGDVPGNYCFRTTVEPDYHYGVMDMDRNGDFGKPHFMN